MPRASKVLKTWLPFAVIGAALVLLIYVGIHQVYRQSANDPQIQMAEDAAQSLANGASPSSVIPTTSVNLNKSLAPFLEIADSSGKITSGSGSLNGSTPILPAGTFDYTKTHTEDRFTWEPQTGLRFAVVMVYYGGSNPGYVIAGRSLKEVEAREAGLTFIAGLDLLGLLIASFLVILITI